MGTGGTWEVRKEGPRQAGGRGGHHSLWGLVWVSLRKLEELCYRQTSRSLTRIVRCVGWKRLIAAVSEPGLGAQAASFGSLVVPAWVGAALAFFLGALWHLCGAQQCSGWQMLSTTPMQLYQTITELCKTRFSSSSVAHEKPNQSWELSE